MKLSHLLLRSNNNIDLLRLIAASAVIVGHSFPIAPQPHLTDVVLKYLHIDYSGSLAVKFFFFLSGLVVTNSWLNKPNIVGFVINRTFRIFPALILCIAFTIFVIGPLTTILSISSYFSADETWRYFWGCIRIFSIEWHLPGVFSTNPLTSVNGSLWTLPFEVVCYLALGALGALGAFRGKLGALIVISLTLIPVIWPDSVPFFGANKEAQLLPFCFALGALFSLYQNELEMDFLLAVCLCLISFVFKNAPFFPFVFYFSLFYSALTLSAQPFIVNLKPPIDISYGVYLYGFPVQQAIKYYLPNISIYSHQAIALLIAIALGTLSWVIIEKKAIELGKKMGRSIHSIAASTSVAKKLAEVKR